MRAAVPAYVGDSFNDCPPGHRFGLYFPVWKDDWTLEKERKSEALKRILALPLPRHAQEVLAAIRQRQAVMLDAYPGNERLSVQAQSTAPFATGLGLEHPLENGFAFLNPYGLPYLPGSSIKGVLRRAAEELAAEPDEANRKGWNSDAVTVLFGLEIEDRQKEHLRGTLTFSDVLPKPRGNNLGMDVMTPHYGDYYQGHSTPHDSGQPNPIVFLVVPAGSEFSFHLTCDAARLTEALRAAWQDLVRAAFAQAFDWLGFGAKTAVGYGAMARDITAEEAAREQRLERSRQAEQAEQEKQAAKEKAEALEKLDPIERSIREFLEQRPDRNQPEISAVIAEVKQGRWQGQDKVAVARWLKAAMQANKGQWKESSQAKKPEKDREYQNTLLVIGWLNGT